MRCIIAHMMNLELLPALITFAFVSSITPGPNNLMLLASGTNFGWTRTIPHMLGISIGFSLMIFGVGVGLMQIFNTYPLVYKSMQALSIAYLLYLAWKIANAKPLDPEKSAAAAVGRPLTFIQAVLFQWVNPKAWGMGVIAISTYAPSDSGLSGIVLVALVFALVNLPCINTWILIGTQLSRFLQDPKWLRIFNVTAAVAMVASVIPVMLFS